MLLLLSAFEIIDENVVSNPPIILFQQVFEEVGGVGALQSNGNRTGAASASMKSEVFILRVHEIISHGYETRPDTKVLRTLWSSRREPQALAQVRTSLPSKNICVLNGCYSHLKCAMPCIAKCYDCTEIKLLLIEVHFSAFKCFVSS